VVTGNIVGRELTRDPGLHRSLMGDGVSTVLSGLFGSVPTTTYGENIGVIAVSGIRMLVEAKVDYSRPINLILTAIVLIVGISGAAVKIGDVQLKGMALATVVGMALSLLFHLLERLGLVNVQADI